MNMYPNCPTFCIYLLIYVIDSELWINLRISKITRYFQTFYFMVKYLGTKIALLRVLMLQTNTLLFLC